MSTFLEVLAKLGSRPPASGHRVIERLVLDRPAKVGAIGKGPRSATVVGEIAQIHRANIEAIDFRQCRLPSARLFDCTVRECRFSDSALLDWRLWGTSVLGCSFMRCDLRQSVLGACNSDGLPNSFLDTTFSDCDLRETIYRGASFRKCRFDNCNLRDVQFRSSLFEDCTFIGRMDGTGFEDKSRGLEGCPLNRMKHVDFTRADLHWVEFRRMDLDETFLPINDSHLVLDSFPASLDAAIAHAQAQGTAAAKKAVAALSVVRRWAGKRGAVNRQDLLELDATLGQELVEVLERTQGPRQ